MRTAGIIFAIIGIVALIMIGCRISINRASRIVEHRVNELERKLCEIRDAVKNFSRPKGKKKGWVILIQFMDGRWVFLRNKPFESNTQAEESEKKWREQPEVVNVARLWIEWED